MKKVLLSIIFVLSFTLISFSQPDETDVYAKTSSSSIQKLVNQQLEVVKKQKISGYKFHEAYPVRFTGKDIPEIVVSSYGFEKGSTEYIDRSLLQVYQYNNSKKKWYVIQKFISKNDRYSYRPLSFITKGKLLDNKKEQLVVGHRWGNDYSLTPIVYGSTDGKTIKTLIPAGDKAFRDGTAVIKNKELFFIEFLSTVSERYVYKKGKFVRYKGTGADDRKVAGNAKHLIMLEKRNGKFYAISNKNIKMKVGESFSIIRKDKKDSSNYIYRMYYLVTDGSLKYNGATLKAVKSGKSTIRIVFDFVKPDSGSESSEIKITVVK